MKKDKSLPVSRTAFSLAEVSAITGLSQRQLTIENRRGRLQFVDTGGRPLVLTVELRRYLADYRQRHQDHPRVAIQMELFELDQK